MLLLVCIPHIYFENKSRICTNALKAPKPFETDRAFKYAKYIPLYIVIHSFSRAGMEEEINDLGKYEDNVCMKDACLIFYLIYIVKCGMRRPKGNLLNLFGSVKGIFYKYLN